MHKEFLYYYDNYKFALDNNYSVCNYFKTGTLLNWCNTSAVFFSSIPSIMYSLNSLISSVLTAKGSIVIYSILITCQTINATLYIIRVNNDSGHVTCLQ